MQTALETEQSLSLERKLKLHEARESIIGRLAANLPTSINLDSFLKVIVSELGRMMEVDRCDIIKLTPEGELRVSHEWRASEAVQSSLTTPLILPSITKCASLPGVRGRARYLWSQSFSVTKSWELSACIRRRR